MFALLLPDRGIPAKRMRIRYADPGAEKLMASRDFFVYPRRCVTRGQPFGGDVWRITVARQLGLTHTRFIAADTRAGNRSPAPRSAPSKSTLVLFRSPHANGGRYTTELGAEHARGICPHIVARSSLTIVQTGR